MATHASYKPQFYVDELALRDPDDAYPLIRAVAPEVTLDSWRDYVHRRYRQGGLLGLWDEKGGIVGVLSYRLGERLRHGRVLALDDFVTFELSQAAPGRATLMDAAEHLARTLGCTGIEVRIGYRGFAEAESPRAEGWVSLGLSLDSVIFTKPI